MWHCIYIFVQRLPWQWIGIFDFPLFFYTNSTDLVCGATILCRCHKHLCFSYFMLSLFPLFLLFSSSLSLSFALTLIYYNTQTA